ncbi:hypothetical protein F5Y10DRAFT_279366 [Nemania abortiva]|nr:hypothetical protein F5Y10DRAFT_279366 [Nemania abortiva]
MGFTINTISQCGRKFIIIDLLFTVIAFIFLGLRFWSARLARRKLYPDDYAAIAAMVSKSAMTASQFWGTFNGLGHHIIDLSVSELTVQAKILLISEFTYLGGTAFVKLSMLCLYYRIYTTPVFRRWCYVVIAADIIYIIGFIPLFLTNCIPISQYWDPKPTGWCRDTLIGDHATVFVNLVLDLAVLALPLPVLWRLRMSIRDKLTVTAMFSLGVVTIAFVIWRLVVIQQTRASPDWVDTLCQVGVIAALEVYLGIIAVCIPTLGPLFNAYLKPLMNRLGISNSTAASKPAAGKKFLVTFGSGGNKQSHGYTEFGESVDHIVSRDGSMKLAPMADGKVVSECTSTVTETQAPNRDRDGIHVQRDIEAIYHSKKGGYYN